MNHLHFIQTTPHSSSNSPPQICPPIQLIRPCPSPEKFQPTSSITLSDSLHYYTSPKPQRCLTEPAVRCSLVVSQTQESTLKTMKIGPHNKRHTLPAQFTLTSLQQSKKAFRSPSRRLTNIIFTYYSKQEQVVPTVPLNAFPQTSQPPNAASESSSSVSLAQASKVTKRARNKLNSKQFELTYDPWLSRKQDRPFDQIRRTNRQLQQLLKELVRESDILTQNNLGKSTFNKQSKLTQTTISVQCEGKNSQLPSQKPKGCYQSHQKPTINLFAEVRSSLAERLPSCKQLGKTIILNPGYDFGGLIAETHHTQPQFQLSDTKIQQSCGPERYGSDCKGSWKQWNQITTLVSQEGDQDMKESIHCGPDVRANRLECEMLRGFGRQITESLVSFQE